MNLQHEMCSKCHFSIKGNCFGKCECHPSGREVQPPRVGSRGWMGTRGQFDAGDENDINAHLSEIEDLLNFPQAAPPPLSKVISACHWLKSELENALSELAAPVTPVSPNLGGNTMIHEVAVDKLTRGVWRVEAINHTGEGECFVTIFSGPDAENRAKEYATWKNQ